MGKKHDDIVMGLTEEKIKKVFVTKLFGKKACWFKSRIGKIYSYIKTKDLDDEIKRMNFKEFIIKSFNYTDYTEYDDYSVSEALIKIEEDHNYICGLSFEDSIELTFEHEFPITKGSGKYKTEIGFLDIVCTLKPISKGEFSPYKLDKYGEDKLLTLIIDAKPVEEFEKDTGAIIRQIKHYKEFYESGYITKWAIYSDKEPPAENVKYIEHNNIICMWDELKKEENGDATGSR